VPSKFLIHYPKKLTDRVQKMIANEKLDTYLLDKYPSKHNIQTDKALYNYTIDLRVYLTYIDLKGKLYD
jgi:hypothetical protein